MNVELHHHRTYAESDHIKSPMRTSLDHRVTLLTTLGKYDHRYACDGAILVAAASDGIPHRTCSAVILLACQAGVFTYRCIPEQMTGCLYEELIDLVRNGSTWAKAGKRKRRDLNGDNVEVICGSAIKGSGRWRQIRYAIKEPMDGSWWIHSRSNSVNWQPFRCLTEDVMTITGRGTAVTDVQSVV